MSTVWVFLWWILPAWLVPLWLQEKVERVIYDGMTRHEWFQAQLDEYHAMQRERETRIGSVDK